MGLLLTLHLREPVGLVVVFRGNGESVEEHQEDHKPVEDIRLDCGTTLSSAEPIPAAPVAAGRGARRQGRRGRGGCEMQCSSDLKGTILVSFLPLMDLASAEQYNLVARS